jgi:predicted nucleic acid-binding protein
VGGVRAEAASRQALTLTDAGPLVALVMADDANHRRCAAALLHLRPPMVTTMAAFAEAMHLTLRSGWRGQEQLWQFERSGGLAIHELTPAQIARSYELMRQYCNVPMDLADATLVALAEALGERRIFTVDEDFAIYRTHDGQAFELIP